MFENGVIDVVQVIYPGVTLLDVTGPAQVFGNAGQVSSSGALETGDVRYRVTVVSSHGGPITTDTGIVIDSKAIRDVDTQSIDTLLVSGGTGVFDAMDDHELIRWLQKTAPSVRRVGSTCMGAFLIANAGLSDGETVTTHWRWAGQLAKRFPKVTVEPDQIFIPGPPLWSSAGVTSGIDMSLAMVEEDLGHKVSIELAKAILVYYRRPGNQAQYSNRLKSQLADEAGRFDALHDWIMDNLRSDLSAERLADVQGMSPRNFARTYKALTGLTPAKAVEEMRVEEGKRLLTRDGMNIGAVARAIGFGSETTMKRAFLRILEMTPSDYQARYARRSLNLT